MNPNPRIGVLLKIFGASVRLYNQLNPRFGMQGLNRFSREWPEERLLKELPGFGMQTLKEWKQLLARRKRHNVQAEQSGVERNK
jgi:hypothetical protein